MNAVSAVSLALFIGFALSSCQKIEPPDSAPIAISNNAVAIVDDGYGVPKLYSFYGLEAGKTWKDVSTASFVCMFEQPRCTAIDPPPVNQGRLAATSVTIGYKVYIIGGYTVTEDGSEVSTPEIFEYDSGLEKYRRLPDMPTPVDDMTAFTYQDRYIYLVSGWHDTGNVNLVQVFDTQESKWFRATDYPGTPVFGHAGGIVGGQIIIADGVAVTGKTPEGRRQFGLIDEVWQGIINAEDPAIINWTSVPSHPGVPLYRMAAAGDDKRGRIIFAGGGDNAYNYNGIGYDGVPAKPSDKVFAYDFDDGAWVTLGTLENPTMDHRGLLQFHDHFYTVGGMDADQNVIAGINRVRAAKK